MQWPPAAGPHPLPLGQEVGTVDYEGSRNAVWMLGAGVVTRGMHGACGICVRSAALAPWKIATAIVDDSGVLGSFWRQGVALGHAYIYVIVP